MKPILSIRLLFIFSLFIFTMATAQEAANRNYPVPTSPVLNAKSKPGWYAFEESSRVSSHEIFTTYKALFGLSAADEMRIIKSATTDPAGNIHTKYKQYYKGFPVEGSTLIVHARQDSTVYLVNGNIIRGLNLSVNTGLTEQIALEKALRRVPAKTYLWQDSAFENVKKKTEKSIAAPTTLKAHFAFTQLPATNSCLHPILLWGGCLIYM